MKVINEATAPPATQNFPFEYVNDMSELNRKRVLRVEEARKDIYETGQKYQKKLTSQQTGSQVNDSLRVAVDCVTLPALGSSMIFPIVIPFTLPIALGGMVVSHICDLVEDRIKSKQARYASIVARSQATLSHLDSLTKDVLTDGIVTSAEFELVIQSYSDYKKNIL